AAFLLSVAATPPRRGGEYNHPKQTFSKEQELTFLLHKGTKAARHYFTTLCNLARRLCAFVSLCLCLFYHLVFLSQVAHEFLLTTQRLRSFRREEHSQ